MEGTAELFTGFAERIAREKGTQQEMMREGDYIDKRKSKFVRTDIHMIQVGLRAVLSAATVGLRLLLIHLHQIR